MSSEAERREMAAHLRSLMGSEGETIGRNARNFNRNRYEAAAALGDPYEELRDTTRAIKADAIDRLPELIDALGDAVEANGGTLYVADDAADANRYVEEVCADVEATSAVKSKSMTTEEIGLNDHLESAGVEVTETDLGELVIQVADEEPSHIIAPAFHRSESEIAALFDEHFDLEAPLETAEELTKFARDYLDERIADADVGITGANFVVSETGTIAIVTNEGNARKCIESTNVHVAVAGVEKVLPSLSDLRPFLELLARSGTGQATAIYNTLVTGPVNSPPVPEKQPEEREFHLVLVDNGRLAMREDDDLRETLYCVRCGACANTCANYQSVGGHAFGGETYTGGIATGWEAGVNGLETAAEFNDLCTGCSRCVDACPVKIDIPWINTVVRSRINRGHDPGRFDFLVDGLLPDDEPDGPELQKRLFGNFETLAKVGSATAPASNWLLRRTAVRQVLERVAGVDPRRELPEFRRETLVDWAESRDSRAPSEPVRKAVLYPDLYTNYVLVERGKAAVRTLEALGVKVEVPPLPDAGRAPFSQGMIDTARAAGEELIDALELYLDADRDVVVIEPSDLAMIRQEYANLLSEAEYRRLADNSYDVLEYVYGLLESEDVDPSALSAGDGEALTYHTHCQQRTLGVEEHAIAVLERLGYDVSTTDAECCGMVGSFGYKSEYYELSMDVGSYLNEQLPGPLDDEVVVATGASCVEQITALSETPTHPIELIGPSAGR